MLAVTMSFSDIYFRDPLNTPRFRDDNDYQYKLWEQVALVAQKDRP